MSAIITNKFRRDSCQSFLGGVDSSYYIGLGKADPWPDNIDDSGPKSEDSNVFKVPLPNSTYLEDRDVLDNLMVLVRNKNKSLLIPRNPWKSGRKYKT